MIICFKEFIDVLLPLNFLSLDGFNSYPFLGLKFSSLVNVGLEYFVECLEQNPFLLTFLSLPQSQQTPGSQ